MSVERIFCFFLGANADFFFFFSPFPPIHSEVLHKTFTPDAPARPFTNAPLQEDDLRLGNASKTEKLRALDQKLSRLR